MQTKSFSQTMSDGFEIWINRWAPDSDEQIKGVIQLHHGLAEHSMRYDRLGSVLAENGFVLNAYDMRGHGHTAEDSVKNKKGQFGKIADKDGFSRAVNDLYEITNALRLVYPGKKLFLLGHSFGSFVAQSFIQRFPSIFDGCVLCGTCRQNKVLLHTGKFIAEIVKLFKGKNATSNFLEALSFGSYNRKIENPKNKYDWLSANEMNISMYDMDNWCGIPLTTSFYTDMLTGIAEIQKNKNVNKISKDLPIYLIYGQDDPVGNYGKSVKQLYNIYKKKGIKNVSIKEYEGCRHELLNETISDTVEKDIINWFSQI